MQIKTLTPEEYERLCAERGVKPQVVADKSAGMFITSVIECLPQDQAMSFCMRLTGKHDMDLQEARQQFAEFLRANRPDFTPPHKRIGGCS